MKKGINLSLGRKRVDNVLKKVFYVSVGAFCLAVVISLGLIAYRLILKSSYDSLDQKEQQLNVQLLELQDKRDKLTETKSRIVEIKQVIAKRAPVTGRIQTLSDLVPVGSTVTTINGSDVDMKLSLESDSLSSLNELIEKRIEEAAREKAKGIKRVDMNSFGLNPKTLQYSVSLGITFN